MERSASPIRVQSPPVPIALDQEDTEDSPIVRPVREVRRVGVAPGPSDLGDIELWELPKDVFSPALVSRGGLAVLTRDRISTILDLNTCVTAREPKDYGLTRLGGDSGTRGGTPEGSKPQGHKQGHQQGGEENR